MTDWETRKRIALAIPIGRILEHEGFHKPPSGKMWASPFREDKNPSFAIYTDTNRGVDYGSPEKHRGGDGINLIQKLKGLSFMEAVDYLLEMDGIESVPNLPCPSTPKNTGGKTFTSQRIDSVGPITARSLIAYLHSRHIPLAVAQKYCREVHYTYLKTGSEYFGIGFPNDAGGWVIRTAPYPKCPKGNKLDILAYGITTIRKEDGKVCKEAYVFEGVFDFLSWVTLYGDPDKDVIVLNSVENVKALSRISSSGTEVLYGYLDNDIPGKAAVAYLAINSGCRVIDRSDLYREEGLNDLNDYLVARHGVQPSRILQNKRE